MAAAPSEESLMAYADGELEPAAVRAMEAALAADPSLAERVAMYRRTRTLARAALAPLAEAPVPDALLARIRAAAAAATPPAPAPPAAAASEPSPPAGEVVAFRSRARPRLLATWGMSLAASLALGVGIGLVAGSHVAPRDGLRTPSFADPGYLAAMTTVPSGAEVAVGDARFRAIATFAEGGGGLCREFEVDYSDRSSVVAVACHADAAWNVTFTVASASTAEGYAPVSSLGALQGYLDAIGAAAPLEPGSEATALAAIR